MTRNRNIVAAIVDSLAAVEHRAPQELTYSLHNHIDTEALRALASMDQTTWNLTFQVPGHQVTVIGDGRIHVDGNLVREGEDIGRQEL